MSESEQYRSLEARLAAISAEMERLKAELLGLESGDGTISSRRRMLKMAGLAVAGAAGAVALRSVPAAAADGGTFTLGQTNKANSSTILEPDTTTGSTPMLEVIGQSAAVPGSTQQGLQGAVQAFGTGSSAAAEGVDGYADGGLGAGVLGQSDSGYGVIGATDTGVDVAAWGTGRLFQRTSTAFTSGIPNFPPTAGGAETIRGSDSSIWASNADGSTWRRVNSVLPISPVRVVDTRNGTGGVTGPVANGSDLNWQVAGSNGVPSGAVGVMGNVGVLSATGAGFVALFPANQSYTTGSQPNFASVGWGAGGAGNFFVSGLGTGTQNGLPGSLGAYINVAKSGNLQLIIDLFAYII